MHEVHRVGCLEYLNWKKSGGSIGLPSLTLVCSGKVRPRVGVSGVSRWWGGGSGSLWPLDVQYRNSSN